MNRKAYLVIIIVSVVVPSWLLLLGIATNHLRDLRRRFVDVDSVSQSQSSLPNIIYIVMDDLGSHDLGMHGTGIQTPAIDRLGSQGMVLQSYYVHPTCTMTRCSIMTGRYPYSMGLYRVIKPESSAGMPTDEETLPQLLGRAGYQRHAVGKWHLGHAKEQFLPTFRGFESFYGFYVGGMQDYFSHARNGAYDFRFDRQEFCGAGCSELVDERGIYSTELFGNRSQEIIEQHHETKGPLFLYLAFQAVHGPVQVPKHFAALYSRNSEWKKNRQVYAGMLTAADEAIQQVLDALKLKGLWNNTLVIFTTDNGGPKSTTSNFPLRGFKKQIWEGGVVGDGIISGPALTSLGIPRGSTMPHLFHVTDWFPTIAHIVGVKPEGKPLDGVSQLDTLRGGVASRQVLFAGYSWDTTGSASSMNLAAIRYDKWKFVRDSNSRTYFLYDLTRDKGEANDVATEYAQKVETLKQLMEEYELNFLPPDVESMSQCGQPTFGQTSWNESAWEPWCDR